MSAETLKLTEIVEIFSLLWNWHIIRIWNWWLLPSSSYIPSPNLWDLFGCYSIFTFLELLFVLSIYKIFMPVFQGSFLTFFLRQIICSFSFWGIILYPQGILGKKLETIFFARTYKILTVSNEWDWKMPKISSITKGPHPDDPSTYIVITQ